MMTGFGMGFGWFGIIFMVLFWVVIIGLAVWLLGQLFPGRGPQREGPQASDSATAILKNRYARGEISKEEFEEMRHEIEI